MEATIKSGEEQTTTSDPYVMVRIRLADYMEAAQEFFNEDNIFGSVVLSELRRVGGYASSLVEPVKGYRIVASSAGTGDTRLVPEEFCEVLQ